VSPLLERGRDIYVTACAKCHSPEPVRDYSRQEWVGKILPEMIKVTKLGPEDARAVEAYVLAVLQQPVAH
jgi:mono/diheme cytochrome c family protein